MGVVYHRVVEKTVELKHFWEFTREKLFGFYVIIVKVFKPMLKEAQMFIPDVVHVCAKLFKIRFPMYIM